MKAAYILKEGTIYISTCVTSRGLLDKYDIFEKNNIYKLKTTKKSFVVFFIIAI